MWHWADLGSHLRPGWPVCGEHGACIPMEGINSLGLRSWEPSLTLSFSTSMCSQLPHHATSVSWISPGCLSFAPTSFLSLPSPRSCYLFLERPSWKALAKALWPVFCTATRISSPLCVLTAQSSLTLCDPMDCSPPAPPVGWISCGILQVKIMEGIAISFSRGSSWPRDWTQVSCIVGRFFTIWATGKSLSQPDKVPLKPRVLKAFPRALPAIKASQGQEVPSFLLQPHFWPLSTLPCLCQY